MFYTFIVLFEKSYCLPKPSRLQIIYKDGVLPVPNMMFGCSNDNLDFTFRGQKISGILGLNTTLKSLVSQLKSTIQGHFSYCLVYSYREMEATSILRFGEDTVSIRNDYKMTPLMYKDLTTGLLLPEFARH
jgi:hypothetical protein